MRIERNSMSEQLKSLKPFSCTFTPNFPELLQQLNCSLAISTFQAGKLIFISPKNENELIQVTRTFHSPMGMAVKGDKLAIATKSSVIVTKNSASLAKSYPKFPNTYDSFYLPMATYFTGNVDLHDLHYVGKHLWAVNTSFSCLATIDDDFSFTPRWKPNFISKLSSEDRCHMNGLAVDGDKLKYVSALGSGDSAQSWREGITKNGVIIDIESNEIIAKDLAMPHAPRIYDGKLYVLLSAAQKLVEVNPSNGQMTDVVHIPGFVRGMAKRGEVLFVATSKLRKNSSTFKDLDIAEKANEASISAIHLPTGAIIGKMTYLSSVDEIYDLQVLENKMRPNIANTLKDTHLQGLITPQDTFWASMEKE